MIDDAGWYLARGSGTVSLILLTIVVALGVATRSGVTLGSLPRFVVVSVHRSAALLACVFVAVHVTSLLLDSEAQLHLVDVVVPFGSAYRPAWVGLGAVTLDLLVAVVVTSVARQRIGRRAWRAVHWAGYALWPIALAHGIGAGTDRGAVWMIAIDAACVLTVLAAAAIHPALRAPTPAPVPHVRETTVPYALTTPRRRSSL